MSHKFSELKLGDTFDFIGPVPRFNSFYERCTKTSSRGYTWWHPERNAPVPCVVGTINCKVFHVKRKED
jgi:hypothetical protein